MAQDEGHERLAGRPPVEASERSVVEEVVYAAHLLLKDPVEVASLGQDFADNPVAVLVRPALP